MCGKGGLSYWKGTWRDHLNMNVGGLCGGFVGCHVVLCVVVLS